ncbi:hypothetical protein CVV38_03585 [Candidatus Peregrinibacteria bacterium HGW-Peregrinibacteria-1]|jgi:hypothetical protein|nr:MAG: hypothetical protein CVV38_03585 [Candidatus Peregrinibacteria bacterium HGW-Peregrinibacteria-1]
MNKHHKLAKAIQILSIAITAIVPLSMLSTPLASPYGIIVGLVVIASYLLAAKHLEQKASTRHAALALITNIPAITLCAIATDRYLSRYDSSNLGWKEISYFSIPLSIMILSILSITLSFLVFAELMRKTNQKVSKHHKLAKTVQVLSLTTLTVYLVGITLAYLNIGYFIGFSIMVIVIFAAPALIALLSFHFSTGYLNKAKTKESAKGTFIINILYMLFPILPFTIQIFKTYDEISFRIGDMLALLMFLLITTLSILSIVFSSRVLSELKQAKKAQKTS